MLEHVLKDFGFDEVSAMECYSAVFRLGKGLIQREGEPSKSFKTKPIIYMKNFNEEHGHYRLLFEDTFQEVLESSYEFDFAIINGLTYFGRKMETSKASKMFALVLDLDGVTDKTLENFLIAASNKEFKYYPMPNYVKLSGHNIHLVYVFDKPLSLYPNVKFQLKQFKYALIRNVWNGNTSTIKEPQFQSINQGFRPIGGKTKITGVHVRCFKTNQEFWNVEELNEYIPQEFRIDLSARYAANKMTFEQAQLEFPEWAESVISNNTKEKKHWCISRNLYEWSKRKVKEHAIYHHRYFGMMLIAICGIKCSFYSAKHNPYPVTKKEVEKDLKDLQPYLSSINPKDPITEDDIKSAMDAFDIAYITFPREDLERLTAIPMPTNRRNYRRQDIHLRMARSNLQILNETRGYALQGRPEKRDLVLKFAKDHPTMSKKQIALQLGISRTTVIKWMRELEHDRH